MQYKKRQARLRLLIKKLNRARKSQAQKIDILCNNIISAQRDYIKALKRISFEAGFYESIITSGNLDELLCTAAGLIKQQLPGTTVEFLLQRAGRLIWHGQHVEHTKSERIEQFKKSIEQGWACDICTLNIPCDVADVYPGAYERRGEDCGKETAVVVPLVSRGVCTGAIFIWHSKETKPTQEQLAAIGAVSSGLAKVAPAAKFLPTTEN